MVVLVDGEPDALQFGEHVGAAGLVGDQQLAPVADELRRDVLVGRGLFHDGGGVDAGLGGERALAHIGRVAVRRAVEDFVERVRDVGQAVQLLLRHADLEFFAQTPASASASG